MNATHILCVSWWTVRFAFKRSRPVALSPMRLWRSNSRTDASPNKSHKMIQHDSLKFHAISS